MKMVKKSFWEILLWLINQVLNWFFILLYLAIYLVLVWGPVVGFFMLHWALGLFWLLLVIYGHRTGLIWRTWSNFDFLDFPD